LRRAKSGDGVEADPPRPDQVSHLIDDTEEALRDLRPAKIPDVVTDAAFGQVAARES
jgi:hypothetical protein